MVIHKSLLFALLACFSIVEADILVLDRWPVLKKKAKDDLGSAFSEMEKTAFPSFSRDYEGLLFSSRLTILNFRITELKPRYNFMSPTFYDSNPDTFTINMPLGYHIKASFIWVYNFFIFPITGKATVETDVHHLGYNLTFNSSNPNDLNITTSLDYTIVPFSDVTTSSTLGLEKWFDIPKKLISMMKSYFPLLESTTEQVFAKVIPDRYKNGFDKTVEISILFSTLHQSYKEKSTLSAMTVRQSLLRGYGKSEALPSFVPATKNTHRQYCVNGGLLDKIVKQVWAKSKSSFRSGDLPPDSVHPITIPGLAMIIPDVILDYSRHEEVLLGLSGATVNPAVTLSVLNSTHGIAHGFQISFSFSVKNTEILKLQVPFDIVISPYSTKRGETAYFNLRTHTAQITQAVRAESKYHTVVKSNAQEAAIEYLNYLFMSNLGYALLGDGVSLKDELTPYSQLSNSVANYAFCLSLLLND